MRLPIVFRAVKSGAINRHNGRSPAFLRRFADGFDVIADQRGDAGVVDEYSGGAIAVNVCLME